MRKQAYNPYLPSFEYVPDAEPHVFDGRVYIYGSHDKFNGRSFCLNDYVCWSAPIDNLSAWQYEGVIYRKTQHGRKVRGLLNAMYAPDVCRGADGRYYLYYAVGYTGTVGVAVCESPAGQFAFLGFVKYADGTELGKKGEPLQFDPAVFVDDDGRIYLYTGFGPIRYPRILLGGHKATRDGAMGFELARDMLTLKSGPTYVGAVAKGYGQSTDFDGHAFFEAPSLRKFNGVYYLIYSSFLGHELCYATAQQPLGPFRFGGTLISIGDIGLCNRTTPKNAANFTGNTHGSILQIENQFFVFYHRQTNRHQFSRQACAKEIFMRPDGGFDQAECTSGVYHQPLDGFGQYSAHIACNLYGKKGARFYGVIKGLRNEPYLTQSGKDRQCNPDQYIANITDGTVIGYKYFDLTQTQSIAVFVKGNARGNLLVSFSENEKPVAEINLVPSKKIQLFRAPLPKGSAKSGLFLRFSGKGKLNLTGFELS